jgi:hypothetical protein
MILDERESKFFMREVDMLREVVYGEFWGHPELLHGIVVEEVTDDKIHTYRTV